MGVSLIVGASGPKPTVMMGSIAALKRCATQNPVPAKILVFSGLLLERGRGWVLRERLDAWLGQR